MTTQEKILLIHNLMLEVETELMDKALLIDNINRSIARNLSYKSHEFKIMAKNYNSPLAGNWAESIVTLLNGTEDLLNY